MTYIQKVLAAEAKISPLEKSHSVVDGVESLLKNVPDLHRTDHHPEIQKAITHLKKVHDKHTAIVTEEAAKLLSDPKPSSHFLQKVKEVVKLLKGAAGSGVQISEKTESIVDVLLSHWSDKPTDKKAVYSRSVIELSKGDKKYYVNLYEMWDPTKAHDRFYAVEVGTSKAVKKHIAQDREHMELHFEPQKIEDDLIRTGFKEVKGKKAAAVRVGDKISKDMQKILEGLKLAGCDRYEITKLGDLQFEREFRYLHYDYDHGEIDDDDRKTLELAVKKANPKPNFYYLRAEFNSEKGYFSVEVRLGRDAAKLMAEDPEKLEKELKL